MTLSEKHIRDLPPEELAATRRLYESAFPDAERIPWKELLRLADEMPLDRSTVPERSPCATTTKSSPNCAPPGTPCRAPNRGDGSSGNWTKWAIFCFLR